MDVKTQESLIVLLYQLAKADNELHPDEKTFIQNVMLKFPEHNPDNFTEDITIPESEEQRMTMLYYLFFMVKSDHEINDFEVAFLQKMAVVLGFRKEMVDNMLGVFKKYVDTTIPPNELIAIIKSYHN